LRHIDTTFCFFPQVVALDIGTKDTTFLKYRVKPKNPGPFHAWAQLDSADVNYMNCTRKKHKRLEWDPSILGFTYASKKNAISFSFPYTSQDGKIIIVGYNIYGSYKEDSSFIFDGGYILAITKDGDKIRIEKLVSSIR
jgi:hypothetical protein